MKKAFLLLFFLFPAISFAQDIQKREIQGKILVPQGMDAEGVAVYNKNSGLGTISSKNGEFQLPMSVGDSIVFTALQFRELVVVVNEEIIESGQLKVEIKEGLNELAEIVIHPHNLTGDLEKDVENIEVVHIVVPEWTAAEIMEMDMIFPADAQSGVRNAAMGSELAGPINLKFLAGKLINLIVPERSKTKKIEFKGRNAYGKIQLEKDLRGRYDEKFFAENFQIPPEEISNFISFSEEKGLHPDLLKQEKEMDLLQLLMLRSSEYRKSGLKP